jgi:Tfp pilus assembly protein PilN
MGKNGKSGRSAVAATKVACAQLQGDRIVVLVGERAGEGLSVKASSMSSQEWRASAGTLREWGVGRVVHVIPGAETIARISMVPAADVPSMVQASNLLAEVQMPESILGHRRAAGVLTGHAESGQTPALMVGWRGDSTSVWAIDGEMAQSWCPVLGALAALRGTGAGSAWFADPSDGSISLVAGTGAGTSARVVVEDNSSAVLWGEGVAATVGEELDEVSMKPRLGLGGAEVERLASMVTGASVTRSWLDVHGPALGAMMLALDIDPALSELAKFQVHPPKVVEHPVLRLAAWLGQPKHATWVTAASLALVLVAPIGIAWARVKILDSKSQSLTTAKERRKELDRRAAVYAELANSRWPMTKLLSDISQATPLGVVIVDLRIQPEQGTSSGGEAQGITLDGVGDSQEKVYDLQANLNKAGLFRNVTVKRSDAKADGGVTFTVTMGVSNVHGQIAASEEWDWAKKNIAVRLHGEGALIKTPPVGKEGAADGARSSSRRASRPESGDAPESKPTEKREAGGVPVALTDEQIAKMERSAAMREMSARRTYPQRNPSLDSSSKKRLEEEVVKLQERIKSLNAAPGKADAK